MFTLNGRQGNGAQRAYRLFLNLNFCFLFDFNIGIATVGAFGIDVPHPQGY